ncbi:MAG TPA: polyribonucleotide nucleotidyltransferase, partial [Candidatus Marinimicrobia bacterium]|nr:polyribonucleotide nucleotidyltransferase [Candidatus Neomarinimicrobiota bacterium]
MIRKEMNLGGRPLILETGLMAKQASGSVYVQYGETSLLVAVTAAKTQDAGRDFFPLQVEYREKAYAGGKIPGGFFKREGRPSDKEILASRLTDRPIRPLFPEDFMAETQVLITVLSADGENPADILGTLGASVALSISDIPWSGPVAAVRVGMIDGQYILNPTFQQLVDSKLDVIVTGTATDVVMVEGESLEISEEELVGAIEFAQKSIKEVIDFQLELIKEINPTKRTVEVDPMKAEA